MVFRPSGKTDSIKVSAQYIISLCHWAGKPVLSFIILNCKYLLSNYYVLGTGSIIGNIKKESLLL